MIGIRIILRDERTHLLRRIVILVVNTRREQIATEHDAPARLNAKAASTGKLILLVQILATFNAVAITHRVETCEIREGLTRTEHIVSAHGCLRVRKLDFHQFSTSGFEFAGSLFDALLHFRIQAFSFHEGGNDTDAHALHAFFKVRRKIGCDRLARAIHMVATTANERIHGKRCIFNAACERTHLIERGAEGDHAITRDHAIGRLHTHHATETGGLADRTTRIRAKRDRCQPRSYRSCRSTRRSTGHALQIPRVARRSEIRCFSRGAESEFVHVELAERQRARCKHAINTGCRIGRNVVLEHMRGAGSMCALHIHVVFEGHWHACKRAKLIEITGGKRVIDELRGSKRRFRGEFEIGMHRRVGFRNMIDARLGDLTRREIARFETLLDLRSVHRSEVHAIHLRQGSQGSRSNRLLASVRSRAPFLAKSSSAPRRRASRSQVRRSDGTWARLLQGRTR